MKKKLSLSKSKISKLGSEDMKQLNGGLASTIRTKGKLTEFAVKPNWVREGMC